MHQTRSHIAEMQRFDVQKVREDFPILRETVHGKPLIYLDNAATSQKPLAVIEAMDEYYRETNSNIHRGVHYLSEKATAQYERSRISIQHFINAASSREVVFTGGTTGAINLVAGSYGRKHVKQGDEIIISALEHHSNIVPWQLLCEEKGAKLCIVPINDAGELIVEEYEKLFTNRTKFVALNHVSNALGTINPVKELVEIAHRHGVPILLDGAQAVPHMRVDVQELGCDFYAFSAHKMYGPTGIGILYGKESLLKDMPPYQGGGDMIKSVTFEKTIYNDLPYKFEAGTPNIAAGVGFGAAVDYMKSIGVDAIAVHEQELLEYATDQLSRIEGLSIIGTAQAKAGVVSFVLENIHPHDIGTILNDEGIAVRTGHHCAQPVMQRFGIPATARASFGLYNTFEEIDALVKGIKKVIEVFD